jgi:homoserine/homoserine lactone efflux protein
LPLEFWFVYVAAVLALMSTPGPSHLLMLSNSATHGFKRSLATVAGDLTANALQMLAAGLGLAALLAASGRALLIIKWLGVRMIRDGGIGTLASGNPARTSLGKLWLQGFLTSAANPKAIVFFAALFPQFINAEAPFWPQFAILSATYILIDGLYLSAYGIGSEWIVAQFRGPARAWIGRIGGSLVISAAVLLSVKTIKQSS